MTRGDTLLCNRVGFWQDCEDLSAEMDIYCLYFSRGGGGGGFYLIKISFVMHRVG